MRANVLCLVLHLIHIPCSCILKDKNAICENKRRENYEKAEKKECKEDSFNVKNKHK